MGEELSFIRQNFPVIRIVRARDKTNCDNSIEIPIMFSKVLLIKVKEGRERSNVYALIIVPDTCSSTCCAPSYSIVIVLFDM